ncbi:hypothetical protein [Macrococcus animalis]|uniref:hypothetical protein n=1 Tax=Macrococcus animalis TaxID=3395467 RepID=UPI0039BDE546
MDDKILYSLDASMSIFRTQAIPGELTLYKDKIKFQAKGVLRGKEIKDTFYHSEIKKIKMGFSLMPYRITIYENNGDSWIFEQVYKKDGKIFVQKYEEIS